MESQLEAGMTTKYSHAFDIAFSLENESPIGEATEDELFQALYDRLKDLKSSPGEILEACGMPFDTYEFQVEGDSHMRTKDEGGMETWWHTVYTNPSVAKEAVRRLIEAGIPFNLDRRVGFGEGGGVVERWDIAVEELNHRHLPPLGNEMVISISNGLATLPSGDTVDLLRVQRALNQSWQDTGKNEFASAANDIANITGLWLGSHEEWEERDNG
jgi:hypothetical protein